ncbi:hypothetical protein BCV69DRAFT_45165 [Microstroma glucosiphilum]|uniref:Uncharacterized protein n=1 Tax=Pseudomicrostroma glucosiphilum TaxID=1684307 RepID=A0A316U1Q8_9BASI|nr:hypothetical protein BCV69DRAFT_45165 [Pseudomicrostroma glucosiphilum]PWN19130.1 hypothetical protein BCV69DRAFT_45165 [Pseudomicrostroma glucosiphilum]
MAIGKGSAASIYATVEDSKPALEGFPSSTDPISRGDCGLGLQLDASSDSASTPTNVSTPIAVPRNTSSTRGEGTSYIDAQPSGHSRPLLERLDMDSASNSSASPYPSGSPPMTPARKRLMELDPDAGGRSPGSRSVHVALTSPSTARTPLAATAPLPETPLKHGHDESTTATPTRSSIVERRRAPAMPPLSPPLQEGSPDRAPRGLGLGLTPTKQSTSAYFGGAPSPAISRGEARGPGTPSSRTKLLEFDMSSTTDEDDSLSLTAQDIEQSAGPSASSSILTPEIDPSSPSKAGGRNASATQISQKIGMTADRANAAKKGDSTTARGSGASRWADPEPQSPTLQHGEADQGGSAASLLSRMSLAPDAKSLPGEAAAAAPSNLFTAKQSKKKANGKIAATATGQKPPNAPAASSALAPPTVADPLSPGSTGVATPVLQTVDAFGGQSTKGLTSQVAAGRSVDDSPAAAVTSDSASASSSASAEPLTEGGTLSPISTAGGSVDSSDPFVGESSACQPASSPMPHFDWADEEDDDDELPDLDGWGVTLAQSTSSPALPETEAVPTGVSAMTSSASAPMLPADKSGASTHAQGPKQKKPAGWGKRGELRSDAPSPASDLQSRLGGIKIAGIAASSGDNAPPTGPRGAGAPPRRELLPGSGPSPGGHHASEAAGGKGPRGRGASGPGGGAWLHDMVQGPPPARRTERPKPQLSEGGAFARLAKGIVGVKGSGPAPNEKTPVSTPVSPPRNAPTGPAAGSGAKGANGGGVVGGKGGKGKGHSSPRKPSHTKSPAKA